jgi:glucose-1-phosphate thymidylyltransferase
VCVVLGDNLIQGNVRAAAEAFRQQKSGARILLKDVDDPQRFGVARFAEEGSGRVAEIIEKPTDPPSSSAVIGIYFYDSWVFDIIRTLKPSRRNELEITDVNNAYLRAGLLEHSMLDGWWTDAGTFESLHRASNLVQQTGANCL